MSPMVWVAPSRRTRWTFFVSSVRARLANGRSLSSESRSEVTWRVTAVSSLVTLLQSLFQRPDWRCSSLRKVCWRCIREKSPRASWRKRTKSRASWPLSNWYPGAMSMDFQELLSGL